MYTLWFILHYLYIYFKNISTKNNHYRQKSKATKQTTKPFIPYKTAKKPPWVKDEIIQMKAMMPELSTRAIAHSFNRKHESVSVGKSYVTYTLREYAYEIQILRKQYKNKPPHPIKFNHTWGIDITFVNEVAHLGVIEHHSRKILELIPLTQKSSIHILLALLQILKYYPKPKYIRSDNERCFTSRLMQTSLRFSGITPQTIDPHSPWQNGQIERFFGTFKTNLHLFPKIETKELYILSYSFKHWYNTIRPHMNLSYQTPDAVYWEQIEKLYNKKE